MVLPVNLSFLMKKPTGISTYARHIIQHLGELDPVFLSAQPLPVNLPHALHAYPIPHNLTPEQGLPGHLRRLSWTQFQLPRICYTLKSKTLFSPLPEAPISSVIPGFRYAVTAFDLIPLRFPQQVSPLLLYHRCYVPTVLRSADRILAISQATARDLHTFFGIPAHKIVVTPLAYDRDLYRPQNLPTEPYFVYIGRQEPYKNLQRLIKALARLPEEVELRVIGATDRRYVPNLCKCAKELGIRHRIKFLGYVPENRLPQVIGRAIALTFPSLWEGFGLPILEAMACGTPVITSDLASMPEVAGDAALLVDPYDVEAIANAMQNLLTDNLMRQELRQAGLAHAQTFSWERTGKLTCEALGSLFS